MATPQRTSLSRYIARVRAIPALSREQEHALAVRAFEGDERARNQLIEANLRFSVAIALQYRHYGIALSELVGEANLGLAIAARRFDPERGTRFVTYAGYWIRALVLDLVVRSSHLVGAGSGALRSKVFFRLRRERARLSTMEPDADKVVGQLAESFGVGEERMRSMLRQLDGRDLSLDEKLYDDSGATFVDTLRADDDQESDLADAQWLDHARGELNEALASLDRRERYIIEQRVMGEDEPSLAELGRRLGVSRERARQLEARAKRKLRAQLESFQPSAA